jgi:hypothetical protein
MRRRLNTLGGVARRLAASGASAATPACSRRRTSLSSRGRLPPRTNFERVAQAGGSRWFRQAKRQRGALPTRRLVVVQLDRLARDHERASFRERASVLGVKPSDLEWPLSSDSEARTFPASVMSPLTTRVHRRCSPAVCLAASSRGAHGLQAPPNSTWTGNSIPGSPACSPTRRSEATRMRIGRVARPTLSGSSNGPIAREVIGAKNSWWAPARRLPAGFKGDEGGGVHLARRTHRRCASRAAAGTRSQSSSSRAARRSGSARCGGSKWWRSAKVSSP